MALIFFVFSSFIVQTSFCLNHADSGGNRYSTVTDNPYDQYDANTNSTAYVTNLINLQFQDENNIWIGDSETSEDIVSTGIYLNGLRTLTNVISNSIRTSYRTIFQDLPLDICNSILDPPETILDSNLGFSTDTILLDDQDISNLIPPAGCIPPDPIYGPDFDTIRKNMNLYHDYLVKLNDFFECVLLVNSFPSYTKGVNCLEQYYYGSQDASANPSFYDLISLKEDLANDISVFLYPTAYDDVTAIDPQTYQELQDKLDLSRRYDSIARKVRSVATFMYAALTSNYLRLRRLRTCTDLEAVTYQNGAYTDYSWCNYDQCFSISYDFNLLNLDDTSNGHMDTFNKTTCSNHVCDPNVNYPDPFYCDSVRSCPASMYCSYTERRCYKKDMLQYYSQSFNSTICGYARRLADANTASLNVTEAFGGTTNDTSIVFSTFWPQICNNVTTTGVDRNKFSILGPLSVGDVCYPISTNYTSNDFYTNSTYVCSLLDPTTEYFGNITYDYFTDGKRTGTMSADFSVFRQSVPTDDYSIRHCKSTDVSPVYFLPSNQTVFICENKTRDNYFLNDRNSASTVPKTVNCTGKYYSCNPQNSNCQISPDYCPPNVTNCTVTFQVCTSDEFPCYNTTESRYQINGTCESANFTCPTSDPCTVVYSEPQYSSEISSNRYDYCDGSGCSHVRVSCNGAGTFANLSRIDCPLVVQIETPPVPDNETVQVNCVYNANNCTNYTSVKDRSNVTECSLIGNNCTFGNCNQNGSTCYNGTVSCVSNNCTVRGTVCQYYNRTCDNVVITKTCPLYDYGCNPLNDSYYKCENCSVPVCTSCKINEKKCERCWYVDGINCAASDYDGSDFEPVYTNDNGTFDTPYYRGNRSSPYHEYKTFAFKGQLINCTYTWRILGGCSRCHYDFQVCNVTTPGRDPNYMKCNGACVTLNSTTACYNNAKDNLKVFNYYKNTTVLQCRDVQIYGNPNNRTENYTDTFKNAFPPQTQKVPNSYDGMGYFNTSGETYNGLSGFSNVFPPGSMVPQNADSNTTVRFYGYYKRQNENSYKLAGRVIYLKNGSTIYTEGYDMFFNTTDVLIFYELPTLSVSNTSGVLLYNPITDQHPNPRFNDPNQCFYIQVSASANVPLKKSETQKYIDYKAKWTAGVTPQFTHDNVPPDLYPCAAVFLRKIMFIQTNDWFSEDFVNYQTSSEQGILRYTCARSLKMPAQCSRFGTPIKPFQVVSTLNGINPPSENMQIEI